MMLISCATLAAAGHHGLWCLVFRDALSRVVNNAIGSLGDVGNLRHCCVSQVLEALCLAKAVWLSHCMTVLNMSTHNVKLAK